MFALLLYARPHVRHVMCCMILCVCACVSVCSACVHACKTSMLTIVSDYLIWL